MTATIAGAIGLVLTAINAAQQPRALPIDPQIEALAHVDRQFEALKEERRGWEPPSTISPAPAIRSPLRPAPIPAEEVLAIVGSYPWPLDEALRVMHCESGGDPNAFNPSSGASGLWQILIPLHSWRVTPGVSVFDAAENTRIAWQLYSERSWQPWIVGGCSPW